MSVPSLQWHAMSLDHPPRLSVSRRESPGPQERYASGKSWLSSVRSRNRPSSNGHALSELRSHGNAFAEPVEESLWQRYHDEVTARQAEQLPQRDEKLRDDPALAWQEFNYNEAMRQATEASIEAFGEDEHAEDDEHLQQALAESNLTAEADAIRRRQADAEEAALQAALRESARAYEVREEKRRRSTTDDERAAVQQAIALSLQDVSGEPGLTGQPMASTSALSVDEDRASPRVTRPLPARPVNGAITGLAPPPVPSRAPPPPPTSSASSVGSAPQIPESVIYGHRTDSPESFIASSSPPQQSYFTGQSSSSSGAHGDSWSNVAQASSDSRRPSLASRHSSHSSLSPRVTVSPLAPTSPPVASGSGSSYVQLPSRESSFAPEDAAHIVEESEPQSERSMDPRGIDLPHGGYRTKSPTQLSRLSEHTELETQPLPTPASLLADPMSVSSSMNNDSTTAIEAGDEESRPSIDLPARPGVFREVLCGPRQESSAFHSARDSVTDSTVQAAMAESTPLAPFGEMLRFGFECDGHVHAMDRNQGIPEFVQLSSEVVDDLPRDVFGVEAATWSTLVRGLMWYGNSRIESDLGSARGELALIATFVSGDQWRAAHVKLSFSLATDHSQGGLQAFASPGRLRLPLPDQFLLPISLAEIAVSLYTLRHLAGIALSTQPGRDATNDYRLLRQLAMAIRDLAADHGELGQKSTAVEEGKLLRRLRQRLARTSANSRPKSGIR